LDNPLSKPLVSNDVSIFIFPSANFTTSFLAAK